MTHHVDQVAGLRSRLAELQSEVQARTQEKELAQTRAEEASAQVATLTQELAQINQEREALGYDATRHEVIKRAATHLKQWEVAQQDAERKNAEHARVQGEAEALVRQIAAHTRHREQAHARYQSDTAAFEQLVAEAGDVAALTAKLGAAKRWKELRQEYHQLSAQTDSCVSNVPPSSTHWMV